jgi:DNA repair photolyase
MVKNSKAQRAACQIEDAPPLPAGLRRGRGARSNVSSRFDDEQRAGFDDGWCGLDSLEPFKTEVTLETARRIINCIDSPDIPYQQSINAYRGCEHGCIYCYARPTHSYLGLSAGLDFETKLTVKQNTLELLEAELAKPGYVVKPITLGSNTDPYQPIERKYQLTRRMLELFEATRHPVAIVTKSALVTRDLDILKPLAERNLVKVALSITTLDHRLARRMEPRASTPERRLEALRQLCEAGIPAAVMTAPIIPALNDHETEAILEQAAAAGVQQAGYVLLRLPLEISPLFQEWLAEEFPDKAKHVMSLVRSARGGKDYDAKFGERQRGTGVYADLIAQRFRLAMQRLGLNQANLQLTCDLFRAPVPKGGQMSLFS